MAQILRHPQADDPYAWGIDWSWEACSLLMPGGSLIGYRMTVAGHRRLLIAQDGVCAICLGCNTRPGEPWQLALTTTMSAARTAGAPVGVGCAACSAPRATASWACSSSGRASEPLALLAHTQTVRRGMGPRGRIS
jgi:hypothetical protein